MGILYLEFKHLHAGTLFWMMPENIGILILLVVTVPHQESL